MKLFQKDPAFYKKVLILAIPIALQSLIAVGVNMLDTIMVGSIGSSGSVYDSVTVGALGKTAAELASEQSLSAVSLSNTFIGIYHIFCMGLGMGASVLVSRYWGMKQRQPDDAIMISLDGSSYADEKTAASTALKQTVCLMLRLTLLLATIFAVVTVIMPETIMQMYAKKQVDLSTVAAADLDKTIAENANNLEIIRRGADYLRYSVITYFFLGTSLTVTIVLRSVGQALFPLFVSIGALFVNLLGNYAFIFGHFGAPRMEVKGAALGTLIARVFEAVMIVGYLLVVDKRIRFRIKDMFMKTGSLLREYIRISIPVLISDGILALGNNSVAMVIGRLGSEFTSANSITAVTQQMSTVGIQGVCQAGAIVTGQTLGQGDKKKTMKQGWMFFGLGIALGLLAAGIILIIKNPVIGGYDVSANTKNLANQLMIAISIILIFQATNSIMTKGVLRGGGDTKMLMLMDNIFLWAIALPLGILAGFVLHLDPFWIYICLKSDQIIKAIWCYFRLKSEKWIKRISTGTSTGTK
ncbi:MAG: polysaccharide biosynthesis C-terminal domain-containing protein [Lachnospiraceae bacterium]|nr:polysaccharide biosynthesis C-terminal domain-containing protein [Lachnospiraceae bacterium]